MAMKCNWSVSTETITEESAEQGEAESVDYADGLSFRDAYDRFCDADSEQGIEANAYPISLDWTPRWFTSYSGQVFPTGDYVITCLHIPPHVTASSRIRIARLLGIIK